MSEINFIVTSSYALMVQLYQEEAKEIAARIDAQNLTVSLCSKSPRITVHLGYVHINFLSPACCGCADNRSCAATDLLSTYIFSIKKRARSLMLEIFSLKSFSTHSRMRNVAESSRVLSSLLLSWNIAAGYCGSGNAQVSINMQPFCPQRYNLECTAALA